MAIDKRGLIHFWNYYAKKIYTWEEEEKEFKNLIEKYGSDKVLDFVVVCYIRGDDYSTIMLKTIQSEKEDELFESLPDISEMGEEEKKLYDETRRKFVQIISSAK